MFVMGSRLIHWFMVANKSTDYERERKTRQVSQGWARLLSLRFKDSLKWIEYGALRDRLEEGIRGIVPGAIRNGPLEQRLPNTVNLTLPGMRGESVVLALDHLGVALSSGSACRAGAPEPSHALLAMGLSPEEAHCALRFSLGRNNAKDEIDHTISLMGEIVRDTATGVRFVPCR